MRKLIITNRDLNIFNYISEMNYLAPRSSLLKFFSTKNALKLRICRLLKDDYLTKLDGLLTNSKSILTLTTKSKRLISKTNESINEDYLIHDLYVNVVRTKIEKELDVKMWISENNLAKAFLPPVPDSAFIVNSKMFALEVERTLKSHDRYNQKFLKYETHPYYEKVLYFITENNEEIEFVLTQKLLCNEKIAITKDSIFPNVKVNGKFIHIKDFVESNE